MCDQLQVCNALDHHEAHAGLILFWAGAVSLFEVAHFSPNMLM